jgi:hypothetical protein
MNWLPDVEEALNRIGNPAGPIIKDTLDREGFVHFMSITIVEVGGRSPSYLLLELTTDDAIPQVFERIATTIGQPLQTILNAARAPVGARDLRISCAATTGRLGKAGSRRRD